MITLVRTNADDQAFHDLVSLLDEGLKITDGDEHAFYDQFNKINNIKHVIIAYDGDLAIGCGSLKEYDDDTIEIKRMFTMQEHRGKGAATQILLALETWARELKYTKAILETGIRQVEAIQLYHKNGYTLIPNYGQYEGVENSVCFEKELEKNLECDNMP